MVGRTRTGCPFCPERIETGTPRFVGAGFDDGRIRVGQAMALPNLPPYAAATSVCSYGAELNHLPLA